MGEDLLDHESGVIYYIYHNLNGNIKKIRAPNAWSTQIK